MQAIPALTLNTNDKMPLLGLGVYKSVAPGEVESAIFYAMEAGYRLIDTASVYKNEDGVGRAVKPPPYPERICSSPRRYGIRHSGWAAWKVLFPAVWNGCRWIMWISI